MKSFLIVILFVVPLVICSIEKRDTSGGSSTDDSKAAATHEEKKPVTTAAAAGTEHDSHQHHHAAKHWGYRNQDKSVLPKEWYKSHPQCYGTQQSPINIETRRALVDESLQTVHIQTVKLDETSDEEQWEILNNGHSVVLFPKTHKIRFVAENSTYELLQMHFHWRGSEHYLNGHRFASELHLVHRNLNNSNKFAVIGFFFEQSNGDNPDLKPIVDNLDKVIVYNSRNKIDTLHLGKLLPLNIDKYYRYPGSLTTPGCDEIVDWFVVHEPILSISDEQVLDFQSVLDKNGYPMLTNSRPIQEINQRYVRKSFLGGFEAPSGGGGRYNLQQSALSENSSTTKMFNLNLLFISLMIFYQLFH